jgi:hypothetical protein
VSPSEHPAHLSPDFLHVCLLSFLNFLSLPVRILRRARASCERWRRNRDLTMGKLEAWDEETLSKKHAHSKK